MKRSELEREIYRTIQKSTETECQLTPEKYLTRDLGLSSMEIFVLLGDLESRFGILIPVKRLRHVATVGDLSEVVIELLRGK